MKDDMKDDMKDEQSFDEETDQEEGGGFKTWIEDNLRIILSILVVFAIAGGIYSYSQRSETPTITEETETEKIETSKEETAMNTEEEAKEETTEEKKSSEEEEAKSDDVQKETRPAEVKKPSEANIESRETAEAFIETAVRGDGATHLARRALGNYLEKNPNSSLSREHKVYIEDYLQKNTRHGRIGTGTNLEFSKSLIEEAIGKSKQLNERQLQNLKKYTDRAPSLR